MQPIQHLCIVVVVPAAVVDKINELAEVLGMGVDNVSIPLYSNGELTHYASSSWWTKEKYIAFKDTYNLEKMGVDIESYRFAIDQMTEFLVDTEGMSSDEVAEIPSINMRNALLSMNLSLL